MRVLLIASGYFAIAAAVAMSPDSLKDRAPDERDAIARGVAVWRASNCAACHSLFGLGGQLGPDLTDVLGAKGELYVKASLAGGRPGMPVFDLSPAEFSDLAAYLRAVDASGDYPLRTRPLPAFGRAP